ncbi:MAG: 1-acyl-sn-glycerol-3-phosphate acyltransferase [Desulfomicrobium escambiense]|nr:1-acyl-sn-glycerol-3-phosphate acyltransferase [Desulfomicrobium escambiense]
MLGTRWSPYTSFLRNHVPRSQASATEGRYDDEAWSDSSIDVLERLERCGARFHISGLEHIRALNGPAVFVSNHMSTFETLILPGLINPIRPCTYVVKEKLLKGPVWGPIMRARAPIAVTRTDPRKDLDTVMSEGTRLLAEGRSIIIFPRGPARTCLYGPSSAALASSLPPGRGVPVVPVALKTDYWGNSPLLRGFGPVHRNRPVMIEFGAAIPVSGRGKAEHEAVLAFIEAGSAHGAAAVEDQGSARVPRKPPEPDQAFACLGRGNRYLDLMIDILKIEGSVEKLRRGQGR